VSLTKKQKTALKEDFRAWSGGDPPEGKDQIIVYAEHGADAALDEDDVKEFLEEWMQEEIEMAVLKMEAEPKKKPIDALLEAVADAINEYDTTKDHLRHGADSDCIRCRLEAIVAETYVGKTIKRRKTA
jgi:hypothetical protein